MTGDAHDAPPLERVLARSAVCGVVRIVDGKEWVCTRAPHQDDDDPYPIHSAHGYAPRSERHIFRRRYPLTDH